MAAAARAALLLASSACARLASGLHLEVLVHYPEKGSAVEHCGFLFKVATSLGDQAKPANAERRATNLWGAALELPDSYLYSQAGVGIMVDLSQGNVDSPECQAACPRLGPQGLLVQSGPYTRTRPLGPRSRVEVWPAFCGTEGDFGTWNSSFGSAAIGRRVHIEARVPAAFLENPLPRPARLMPPVMFRLNAEWYWHHAHEEYASWHDLMINGMMEPVVVGEVYIEGNNWQAWATQPIYTAQVPEPRCGACDPELRFICDDWERSGYSEYAGGEHSFGSALAFFDELYEQGLPQVLGRLPEKTDGAALRVGVWGYCIGGLAAWNALTARPDRFSLAYLGSPAMDFDCGAPFQQIQNLSWGATRPKIYIDSGAAEGTLMNRQSLLLLRRLQGRGLVEGRDVFYERAEFGTHQGRGLLRRALKGLLVLFGTGSPAYTPAQQQVLVSAPPDGHAAPLTLAAMASVWPMLLALACAAVAFLAGRKSAGRSFQRCDAGRQPLLA